MKPPAASTPLRTSPAPSASTPRAPPAPSALTPPRALPVPFPQTDVDKSIFAAKQLLADHDEVLLYEAPSHTSLVLTSLLGGSIFSLQSIYVANAFVLVSSSSWWLKAPVLGCCAIAVAIGFGLMATPMWQLQSMRLLRTPDRGIFLRFHSKRNILFFRRKPIDASLDEVFSDRKVRTALLTFFEVQLNDRFRWTEYSKIPKKWNLSPVAVLRRFWRALISLGPTVIRDIRRMFTREGMVYLRIKHQNWKMDLFKCGLLDEGRFFQQIVQEDLHVRDSLLGTLRRHFTSL